MKIEERFNRVLAGLSHTGYTTEIEKCEARIFIEELYNQNQKYKEVIDKANKKLTNMFDNGDDNKILEDLLELSKILELK